MGRSVAPVINSEVAPTTNNEDSFSVLPTCVKLDDFSEALAHRPQLPQMRSNISNAYLESSDFSGLLSAGITSQEGIDSKDAFSADINSLSDSPLQHKPVQGSVVDESQTDIEKNSLRATHWPVSSVSSNIDETSINTITVTVNSTVKNGSTVISGTDKFTQYCLNISDDSSVIWSHAEILAAQQHDPLCQLLVKHVKKTLSEAEKLSLSKEYRNYENYTFALHNHVLCRVVEKPENRTVYQTYVPPSLRPLALRLSHNIPSAGHGGIFTSLKRLTSFAFWPKCNFHVENHVRNCIICLQYKQRYGPKAPPLRLHNTSRPFQRVHVDLIGKLIKSKEGHEYILTMIDARTRFLVAVPLRNKTANLVAKNLMERVISIFGPPETLVSDLGSEFVSSVWKALMEVWSIYHLTTAAYTPQSNGLCERANSTIAKIIRTLVASRPKDWSSLLYYAVIAYNTSFHRQIGDSPFYLLNLRDPIIPGHIFSKPPESLVNLDDHKHNLIQIQRLAYERVQAQLDKDYERQEKRHAKFKFPELREGQRIYIHCPPKPFTPAKFQRRYRGPMRITKILGPTTLLCRGIGSGKEFKVNLNNAKILQESEIGVAQSQSVRKAFPRIDDGVPPPRKDDKEHDSASDGCVPSPEADLVLPASGENPQAVSNTAASDIGRLDSSKVAKLPKPCPPAAQPPTSISDIPNTTPLSPHSQQPKHRMHLRSDGPVPKN